MQVLCQTFPKYYLIHYELLCKWLMNMEMSMFNVSDVCFHFIADS